MSVHHLAGMLRHVRRLVGNRPDEVTDGTILERFARDADDAAFATLMRRHGPLVWSVCRRVAGHEQDAEDVYQATFLLLARKAGSIRKRNSGSWLYGVAYRLALRAHCDAARRRQREAQATDGAERTACDNLTWRELRETLDVELARLPEKYRAPLLLCYFEGLSQEEAARQLGWSKRSVKDRVERGRKLLRVCLARRGMTLHMTLAGALLSAEPSKAGLPSTLSDATLRGAAAFARHRSVAGLVSPSVLDLIEPGFKTMFVSKLLISATLVLMAATLGSAGLFLDRAGPESKPEAVAAVQADEKEHVDSYGDQLPRGAMMRLGTIRYRFQCSGLAFLPKSETVISAKQGGAIQLWEARTGRLIREIDTGPFMIGGSGFSLSRDGERLALGGSLSDPAKPGWRSAVRVFDVVSGKAIRTFEETPSKGFNTLALTPDGKLLLTLDREGGLKVAELATGTELLQHKFPGDVMASLALSADGSTLALATGPNTRKLLVWKWQTAEEPREFKTGDYHPRNVAFSPDARLLAASDDLEASVRVWEVQSGQLLHKLELPDQEPYRHFGVAFSADGNTLAAYGQTNQRGAVHLWDTSSGKFLQRLKLGGSKLAFSPNGRLLASGWMIWDFDAGRELSANDQAHSSSVDRIVTGDKDLVVTASSDNSVRIWDAADGKQKRQLGHDSRIPGIALSPDGTLLVSSSMDDTVCLWNVASGQKIFKLPGHGQLGGRRAVAFTPDGKFFLSWGDDMDLRKWDVKTGKAVAEYAIRPTGIRVFGEGDEPMERDRLQMMGGVTDGIFTPDARELVLHSRNKIFVFDAASGKELRNSPMESGFLIGQAISPDGQLFLTSTWGKPVTTKLPDGRIQSSTPMNHPVSLWELAIGGLRKQITLPEQGAGPVAFSRDGKLFAAASYQPGDHIRVWDAAGQEVRAIEGFRGVVRSLAFMADSKRLVTGMEDGSALVWDLTQKP